MTWPIPRPGLVIRYSYLWRREAAQGREEGAKERPCAVILALRQADGADKVFVLPITHSPPVRSGDAIALPPAVKQRLGLDEAPSWVMLTETNSFIWPGPDLRVPPGRPAEEAAYGFLPPKLFQEIRDRFLERARNRQAGIVPRSE